MTRWVAALLSLALLTWACHATVPPTRPPPTHHSYWGLSAEVQDTDSFCVQQDGRFYCISVANLKQFLLHYLYSD